MTAVDERTAAILAEIRDYSRCNGYPPSRRELAAVLKTSTSMVNWYLVNMEAAGLVEVDWNVARASASQEGMDSMKFETILRAYSIAQHRKGYLLGKEVISGKELMRRAHQSGVFRAHLLSMYSRLEDHLETAKAGNYALSHRLLTADNENVKLRQRAENDYKRAIELIQSNQDLKLENIRLMAALEGYGFQHPLAKATRRQTERPEPHAWIRAREGE